nr:hypothetical protein [uncultured Desulfuromonas sp.]
MRFIHTSDIHLGKTYRNAPGETERYEDFFTCLAQIVADAAICCSATKWIPRRWSRYWILWFPSVGEHGSVLFLYECLMSDFARTSAELKTAGPCS